MEKREGMLMWAGAAAVVGLLLGAGALTIAIIAAVSLPMRASASGVVPGNGVGLVAFQCLAAAFTVMYAVVAMACVVRRREIGFRLDTHVQPRKSPIGGVVMGLVMLAVVGLGGVSLFLAIRALSDANANEAVRASASLGASISAGTMSVAFSSLSGVLFAKWRYENAGAGHAVDALPQHA